MRGWEWLAISTIVVCLAAHSSTFECRVCKQDFTADKCNATSCLVDCPVKECPCDGLCSTTIVRKQHVIRVFTQCFMQPNCNDTRKKKEYLYSREQLDGHCQQRGSSTWLCECGTDRCNDVEAYIREEVFVDNTTPSLVTPMVKTDPQNPTPILVGSCVGILLVLIGIIFALWCVRRHKRLKDDEVECKMTTGSRLSSDDVSLGDGPWDDSGKHSFSYRYSSSTATQYTRGSRGNALNHNDHHLPIELQKIIGRGHFSEVWKAKLQQDCSNPQIVSVKVFRLRNYGAWRQEKEMLAERWMRHENLIEFYASEQHTVRGRLQYWLVTAYYEQGSLAQYLRTHKLDWFQFCDMAISIAKGLSYLHSERDDTGRTKLPIAHRDIKSSNILVRDNCNSCVLADFGLSLKLDPLMSRDELSNAGQVGTSRYMAPELLERLVNLTDIEMFKRIDVYALALVLWEMANRCEYAEGMASTYKPPFGDQINDHPTKERMLILVCRERQKPDIPTKWMQHKGLLIFINILTESWEYEAEARITAGTIHERFMRLRQFYVISDSGLVTEAKTLEERENEMNQPAEIISTVV